MTVHLAHQLPNAEAVDRLVWQTFRDGGTMITHGPDRPFGFATGELATLKADAENLADSPVRVGMILGIMALHPCVEWADMLIGVPNGMNKNALWIGQSVVKPVVGLIRPEVAQSRYEYEFANLEDMTKLEHAAQICLLEDVSRTGSTAWHVARFLRQHYPHLIIHSLTMLQRGPVAAKYQVGPNKLDYHWLCRRDIPLDAGSFAKLFGFEPDYFEA